jgi:PPE-repeat protein
MDFAALPPEINSGRMYTGAGPGPLLAAAAAWDRLASELGSTASSYQSVVDGLTGGSWQGATSGSMAAAVTPYVAWMSASAAQAEQTAGQARSAAAAYEAAFAGHVPPPVIAANRSLLMMLIATNILGQNPPAIAAAELHYAEMWAQDAAAMYGYAGSSATATRLTPFSEPPQTTNPAGTATQSAAVTQAAGTSAGTTTQSTLSQAVSAVPAALQSLASSGSSATTGTTTVAAATTTVSSSLASSLNTIISDLTGSLSPASLFTIGGVPYLLGIQGYLLPQAAANLTGAAEKFFAVPVAGSSALLAGELGSGTPVFGPGGAAPLSAGLGNAGLVGKLSAPQSWTTAAPAIKPVALQLPEPSATAAPAAMAEGSGGVFGQMGLSSLAGRAMAGTGGGVVRSISTGGSVAAGEATTATIIVIPPDEEML